MAQVPLVALFKPALQLSTTTSGCEVSLTIVDENPLAVRRYGVERKLIGMHTNIEKRLRHACDSVSS